MAFRSLLKDVLLDEYGTGVNRPARSIENPVTRFDDTFYLTKNKFTDLCESAAHLTLVQCRRYNRDMSGAVVHQLVERHFETEKP